MDKDLFNSKSLGKLIKIHIHNTDDYAFIPDALPIDWQMPNHLWPLLANAKEELARLDGVGRHMPNYELFLRPLQQREALKSSSLEGTYATLEQLLLFEIDPKEPKSSKDPVNSWKEVSNYTRSLKLGQDLLKRLPISLRLIKELHNELLRGVRGDNKNPGNFRKTQVHIGSDRRFIPPPPISLMNCLNDLELYIHKKNNIDPLIFSFMVHYQFETIHPFLDGNGRVGRLLLSLMIFQNCNIKSPWLYLSAFFEKYKDEYISYLFEVSSKGSWDNWLTFCLRATIYQSKDAIKRCDQLLIIKEKYSDLIMQKGENVRLNKIIEMLFEYPVFTIPQVSKWLNVSYPTARSDVLKLIKLKLIVESTIKYGQSKFYLAVEILNIAYNEYFDE
jgi:Fic family protein